MSELSEVADALQVLTDGGKKLDEIYLLHCTTQYPTPYDAVNLRAMDALAELGTAGVGYSDHTVGIEVPVAAVAMGACIIEKHFTLDKTMEGPDHRASLDVDELRAMVRAIRNVEAATGNGGKHVVEAERANIVVARKSIVAACEIKKGELLTSENLTVKRPGNGLSPMLWDKIVGTRAVSDFLPDQLIEI